MKRRSLLLIGILAVATAGGLVWANPTPVDSLVDLRRKNCAGPPVIKFVGPGKAVATRDGVTVTFRVLVGENRHGKAEVHWRNPLQYRRHEPRFAGFGRARIRLVDDELRFGMKIRGSIKRTDSGDLIIYARFGSIRSSVDDAKFNGRFFGKCRL